MKLNITIDGKTYEVDVEVAEADHAGLPPAYPIGSARLAGSVVGSPAPVAAPSAVPVENEAKVCRSPVSGAMLHLVPHIVLRSWIERRQRRSLALIARSRRG